MCFDQKVQSTIIETPHSVPVHLGRQLRYGRGHAPPCHCCDSGQSRPRCFLAHLFYLQLQVKSHAISFPGNFFCQHINVRIGPSTAAHKYLGGNMAKIVMCCRAIALRGPVDSGSSSARCSRCEQRSVGFSDCICCTHLSKTKIIIITTNISHLLFQDICKIRKSDI